MSKVTIVITHIRGPTPMLMTAHEPPSTAQSGFACFECGRRVPKSELQLTTWVQMGLGFRVHDECRGVYLHSRANLNFCLEVISVSALAI